MSSVTTGPGLDQPPAAPAPRYAIDFLQAASISSTVMSGVFLTLTVDVSS